jgi:hypothetical protein
VENVLIIVVLLHFHIVQYVGRTENVVDVKKDGKWIIGEEFVDYPIQLVLIVFQIQNVTLVFVKHIVVLVKYHIVQPVQLEVDVLNVKTDIT